MSMDGLVIATTSTCGPCRQAKQWMQQRGIPFQEMVLDGRPDLVDWTYRNSGQRTVPQFFLNGQWLPGGFAQVQNRFG